jgi:hypothetical protein
MKQPHWRTRLQRVALLVTPANFFHAPAASQNAFEAIAQAHYAPLEWADVAIKAYRRHKADRIMQTATGTRSCAQPAGDVMLSAPNGAAFKKSRDCNADVAPKIGTKW